MKIQSNSFQVKSQTIKDLALISDDGSLQLVFHEFFERSMFLLDEWVRVQK